MRQNTDPVECCLKNLHFLKITYKQIKWSNNSKFSDPSKTRHLLIENNLYSLCMIIYKGNLRQWLHHPNYRIIFIEKWNITTK
jgi:hypothetical protein